jgi:hypothetical protein
LKLRTTDRWLEEARRYCWVTPWRRYCRAVGRRARSRWGRFALVRHCRWRAWLVLLQCRAAEEGQRTVALSHGCTAPALEEAGTWSFFCSVQSEAGAEDKDRVGKAVRRMVGICWPARKADGQDERIVDEQ